MFRTANLINQLLFDFLDDSVGEIGAVGGSDPLEVSLVYVNTYLADMEIGVKSGNVRFCDKNISCNRTILAVSMKIISDLYFYSAK